jgi:hypothetical protein
MARNVQGFRRGGTPASPNEGRWLPVPSSEILVLLTYVIYLILIIQKEIINIKKNLGKDI